MESGGTNLFGAQNYADTSTGGGELNGDSEAGDNVPDPPITPTDPAALTSVQFAGVIAKSKMSTAIAAPITPVPALEPIKAYSPGSILAVGTTR